MNLWRTFQSSPYFYWTFLGLLWSSVSFFGKQSTAIMPSFRLTGVSQPPWNAFRGPSDEPGLLQTCFLPINVNGKEHKRLLMMLTTFSSLPPNIFPFCVYLYRPQINWRTHNLFCNCKINKFVAAVLCCRHIFSAKSGRRWLPATFSEKFLIASVGPVVIVTNRFPTSRRRQFATTVHSFFLFF